MNDCIDCGRGKLSSVGSRCLSCAGKYRHRRRRAGISWSTRSLNHVAKVMKRPPGYQEPSLPKFKCLEDSK